MRTQTKGHGGEGAGELNIVLDKNLHQYKFSYPKQSGMADGHHSFETHPMLEFSLFSVQPWYCVSSCLGVGKC